jgi:S1-C subfamily serine protease
LADEQLCTVRITTLPIGFSLNDRGVVYNVRKESQAEFIGIQPGDCILDMDEQIAHIQQMEILVVKSAKHYNPFSGEEQGYIT